MLLGIYFLLIILFLSKFFTEESHAKMFPQFNCLSKVISAFHLNESVLVILNSFFYSEPDTLTIPKIFFTMFTNQFISCDTKNKSWFILFDYILPVLSCLLYNHHADVLYEDHACTKKNWLANMNDIILWFC